MIVITIKVQMITVTYTCMVNDCHVYNCNHWGLPTPTVTMTIFVRLTAQQVLNICHCIMMFYRFIRPGLVRDSRVSAGSQLLACVYKCADVMINLVFIPQSGLVNTSTNLMLTHQR